MYISRFSKDLANISHRRIRKFIAFQHCMIIHKNNFTSLHFVPICYTLGISRLFLNKYLSTYYVPIQIIESVRHQSDILTTHHRTGVLYLVLAIRYDLFLATVFLEETLDVVTRKIRFEETVPSSDCSSLVLDKFDNSL